MQDTEIIRPVRLANRFDHLDRNNGVELPGLIAVVFVGERRWLIHAGKFPARRAVAQLFARQ